jgi:hypothetical protein
MATAAIDFGDLLCGIPRGAWVALSHDESSLIAYAAELKVVLALAIKKGESDPVILRIPELPAALLL